MRLKPESWSRRLLAAMADTTPAFTPAPAEPGLGAVHRLLAAMADATPAFTHVVYPDAYRHHSPEPLPSAEPVAAEPQPNDQDTSGENAHNIVLEPGANLRGADLREAVLVKADLRGADLVGADLRRANLVEAVLQAADLRGADLRAANLVEADLRGADLRGALLAEADLRRADLRAANLVGADLRRATLIEADLRGQISET